MLLDPREDPSHKMAYTTLTMRCRRRILSSSVVHYQTVHLLVIHCVNEVACQDLNVRESINSYIMHAVGMMHDSPV